MTTRRHFIKTVPLVGAAFVVGCSEKSTEAPRTTAAAPTPSPPAPVPPPGAPATTPPAPAAANPSSLPMLDEKDPAAVALGYVTDAAKVDKAKYTTYVVGQQCSGCQLYLGPVAAPVGPCTLFAGKQVNGPGWCSAFVKKAA